MTARLIERLEHRQMLADVLGLELIDAQTDQPISGFDLTDGAVINLATVGRQLNIRAEVTGDAGSVRFNYDGDADYFVGNEAAYAIGGNTGDDYHAWTPALGAHALVVTAYPSAGGVGSRGASKTVLFQVVDSAPPASVVRINAGGKSYTSTSGATFAADAAGAGFAGGTRSFSPYPVAGTTDDPLYEARRFGKHFSFAQAVDNGQYTLILHFAEPTFKKAHKRVFDVSAEGTLVLDDLDLVQAAGAKTALVKTFPVAVTDGQIDLTFDASKNNAIVSAIELVPVPAEMIAVPAPVRIDAGADGSVIDSLARAFEDDDAYFTGGADVGAASPPADYDNSEDDAIVGSYRAGAAFSLARPVADGRYSLWLEFADPESTAAGQRLFDVSAEGVLLLDDFDVFAAAEAARARRDSYGASDHLRPFAVARQFDVNITDGRLDIDFNGAAGDAIVSAVVLVPTDIPPAMIPYSGLADYPSSPQREAVRAAWSARSQSQLRQIGFATILFAQSNRGRLPPDLAGVLDPQFGAIDDIGVFGNPRVATLLPRGVLSRLEQMAWVDEQTDYVFAPGFAGQRYPTHDAETTILVYENPDTTPYDDLNVFYADGHVGVVPRAELIAQLGGEAVAPPEPARPMQSATDPKIIASQQNLRALATSLLEYANDHNGRYPTQLGLLYDNYEADADTFRNPRTATPAPPAGMTREQTQAWINAQTDYTYLAAGRASWRRTPVLMHENPAEMALGMNILFDDGHVEFREMRWALETIAATKARLAG